MASSSDSAPQLVAGLEGLDAPEHPLAVEHRGALIYLLREAAELEHGIMCQYLFAAFSLKQSTAEGLTEDQLVVVKRWRSSILNVAKQEMLHLALVQNLLTSIGAAPHLGRPNFPSPAHYFPKGVPLALVPFGEPALRHFLYLERPEGMPLTDAEGFAATSQARPFESTPSLGGAAPHDERAIMPHAQEYATVGHLYRAIDIGFAWLTSRLGEQRLFVGPAAAQATPDSFGWPQLKAVTDLRSAHAAVDTIVEQGEGVRGAWRTAHFGRFLDILEDFVAQRELDPMFDPARPVQAGLVRSREGSNLPVIDDPLTAQVADLFDVVNEIVTLSLMRYFAPSNETPAQRKALADLAVGLMFTAIEPLGQRLMRMPFGPSHPGKTAGPTFSLIQQSVSLLPDRRAAWVVLEERLREAAAWARAIEAPDTIGLARVCTALDRYARALADESVSSA
jgi:hypothetical protein